LIGGLAWTGTSTTFPLTIGKTGVVVIEPGFACVGMVAIHPQNQKTDEKYSWFLISRFLVCHHLTEKKAALAEAEQNVKEVAMARARHRNAPIYRCYSNAPARRDSATV
jgi:hypothetical protein